MYLTRLKNQYNNIAITIGLYQHIFQPKQRDVNYDSVRRFTLSIFAFRISRTKLEP